MVHMTCNRLICHSQGSHSSCQIAFRMKCNGFQIIDYIESEYGCEKCPQAFVHEGSSENRFSWLKAFFIKSIQFVERIELSMTTLFLFQIEF